MNPKTIKENGVISIYVGFIERAGDKGRPVVILENKDGILHFFNITSKFNSKSNRNKAEYFEI
ncbi:hypothetical protein EFN70_10135 [Pediococcus ethanolidurans]|uniref:hypothetical protein n=1 Tax=Pediococcus ethanolidurans TaxID=319653 RepID=UPI00345F0EB0|nr:hypothetical protein [Pediococcus ethanolidurans]